jgi:hypothetical protein
MPAAFLHVGGRAFREAVGRLCWVKGGGLSLGALQNHVKSGPF